MNLKFAQPEDFPDIEALCLGYNEQHEIKYDPALVVAAIRGMIEKNSVLAAVVDGKIVGGLAGYFFPAQFSSEKYFVTMFCYFHPEHRNHTGEFFRRVTELLQTTDTTQIIVAIPYFQDFEKMDRFYKMMGFKTLETHYVKDVRVAASSEEILAVK